MKSNKIRNKEDRYGKEELNMAEYPIQVLTRTVSDNQKTIEWQGVVLDSKGKPLKARWVVSGSESAGLPRYRDRDVLLGLLYYWKLQGFTSRQLVINNIAEFMRLIKWSDSALGYKRLKEALERLSGVTIVAENCFWDREFQDYLEFISFHLLDEARIQREGKYSKLTVTASKVFWDSIQHGNLKTINLTFYFSLDTPTSKTLYSYLDKKVYSNEEFTIDLIKLAGHIGININQFPKHIKALIKEASTELVNKGFLSSFVFKKSANGEQITFTFNPDYRDPEYLKAMAEQEKYIRHLIDEIIAVVGNQDMNFIEEAARSLPSDQLFRILGEIKELDQAGRLKTSKFDAFRSLVRIRLKEILSLPFVNQVE